MNLLNLFDLVDAVAAQKSAEKSASIPPAVQVSQSDGQPATIVVPVATSDDVEVLEDGHKDSLDLGDEVIITGNVQFKGKTGRIVDFGSNKHFVVVDLYNFGKHSFHSSNVEANDYADSEEEDADWRERDDYGTFGDDKRDEDLNEGFGAYYYEQLAQKVFDERPNFSTKGRADELLDYAYRFAVQDLGKSRARYEFMYDEDFPSDFVSAYAELQRGTQGVAEEVDTGEYDARKTQPSSQEEQDKVFAKHKERVKALSAENNKKKGVAEGSEILKVDTAVRVPHKGKMVPGKVVRYDSGKGGYSPAYVVDIGEYESKIVPVDDVKQGVAEEYDPSYDPEYRGYQKPEQDPDARKQERDSEEPEVAKTVTITDNDGKVVLTFPSTGGFYGDLRYAASKGFNTDSGEYHLSWKRDTNEGNNWLDTPVSEEFDRIKKLAGLK